MKLFQIQHILHLTYNKFNIYNKILVKLLNLSIYDRPKVLLNYH